MKRIYVSICLFVCSIGLSGQVLSERLIVSDDKDSTLRKSSYAMFDKNGNYCFVYSRDGVAFFQTKKGVIGKCEFIGSTSHNYGSASYNSDYKMPDKPYYYKNRNGTTLYGPIVGEMDNFVTSNTRDNIGVCLTFKDSVTYLINGKEVRKYHKSALSPVDYKEKNWAAFSENGNAIYFLKKDSLYELFLNGKLIDTSQIRYEKIDVNDNGEFLLVKEVLSGHNPKKYTYTIKTSGKTLEGLSNVFMSNIDLKQNGTYYHFNTHSYNFPENHPAGERFMVVNDSVYYSTPSVAGVVILDKSNFLFCYGQKGSGRVNINGKVYEHPFDYVQHPSLDLEGNFAFFGIKDGQCYTYVNGRQVDSLFKHGVSATPLYISPKGEAAYYYQTSDSIYLYQKEKLAFPPVSIVDFTIDLSFLPWYNDEETLLNENMVTKLNYSGKEYLLYKGQFSVPLPTAGYGRPKGSRLIQRVGGYELRVMAAHGFFAIKKISEKKHLIIINNKIYKEVKGIDYLVSENFLAEKNYYFDEKSLVFYGVKGKDFYRFELSY